MWKIQTVKFDLQNVSGIKFENFVTKNLVVDEDLEGSRLYYFYGLGAVLSHGKVNKFWDEIYWLEVSSKSACIYYIEQKLNLFVMAEFLSGY